MHLEESKRRAIWLGLQESLQEGEEGVLKEIRGRKPGVPGGQWLGLSMVNAETWSSISGQEAKIPDPTSHICVAKKLKIRSKLRVERTREEAFWNPGLRSVQAQVSQVVGAGGGDKRHLLHQEVCFQDTNWASG